MRKHRAGLAHKHLVSLLHLIDRTRIDHEDLDDHFLEWEQRLILDDYFRRRAQEFERERKSRIQGVGRAA